MKEIAQTFPANGSVFSNISLQKAYEYPRNIPDLNAINHSGVLSILDSKEILYHPNLLHRLLLWQFRHVLEYRL